MSEPAVPLILSRITMATTCHKESKITVFCNMFYALLNCEARLSSLGLQSLEIRWLTYDLLYTYKIVFGLVSDAAMNMFTLTNSLYSISTRVHAYKLYPHNNRIDLRKHIFSERDIAPWNNLPATANHFRTSSSFKRFLNSTDLTMYVSLGF